MEKRELTFGEKACGVSFNPSNSPHVDAVKKSFAAIVDDLNVLRETADNAEIKRMLSLAITDAQTAQMWAVKAVTWSI
jgi:hypothetical protein